MSRTAVPELARFSTLDEARSWANAHYVGQVLRTGEPMLAHAQGIREILSRLDVSDELHITAYLFGYFLNIDLNIQFD